jgi:hypothetical protein
VLPSLELAIEKGAPRRVVGERRQVGIHAGNKAPGASTLQRRSGFAVT